MQKLLSELINSVHTVPNAPPINNIINYSHNSYISLPLHTNLPISIFRIVNSNVQASDKNKSSSNKIEENKEVSLSCSTIDLDIEGVLATVLIQAFDNSGYPIICRAVLDSASQGHVISAEFKQKLDLPGISSNTKIQSLDSSSLMVSERCEVKIWNLTELFWDFFLSTSKPATSRDEKHFCQICQLPPFHCQGFNYII